MFEERPVTLAVHTSMQDELKLRQMELFTETSRKNKGGITTISEIAALELKLIRQSSTAINKAALQLNSNIHPVIIEGVEYIPYHLYKKLFIYLSILNKRKDTNQIVLQIFKPRGCKKHEIKILR